MKITFGTLQMYTKVNTSHEQYVPFDKEIKDKST